MSRLLKPDWRVRSGSPFSASGELGQGLPAVQSIRPAGMVLMEASQVKLLANQLLGQHQLLDWHFQFDHARTRCGSCQYELKRISLSRHFAALNDRAEVKNVLLHEIAHALAGPGVGHGAAWRAQAVRIGARPETTAPEYIGMPSPKWSLVCRNCDKVVAQRHRRALDVTRTRCRQCGIHDGKLEWRRN